MANPGHTIAAAVQMRSGAEEEANIAVMRDLVREAAGMGASYVQTPEMTGAVQRSKKSLFAAISGDRGNRVFAAAAQLASDLEIWLHIGSTAVALSPDKAANRAALFSPRGERVAWYDKLHMFDVDLDHGERWRESAVYQPGTGGVVVSGPAGITGLAICYDLRFPALFRAQARAGAVMLTCPSCFTRQTGEAHWHILLRARAIENGAFMVAAAQGGRHEDERETYGHSLIVDPWGRILAELDGDEPGVIVHEIDQRLALEARARIPTLANERSFTISCHNEADSNGKETLLSTEATR
jgi:deaminated glutathione amidase